MSDKYVVAMIDDGEHEFFWNGKKPFTLDGAKEYKRWAESKYPENIGLYVVYELSEVKE